MRRLTALLFLLVLAAPTWGQSVKLPAEVRVAPGRLASVTVEWDGDDVRWDAPADLDVFREYDPDAKKVRLRLIGYAPGKYRLLAVASKGGKLSEFAACTIVVGDPPAPAPPVTPPSPPPGGAPGPVGALYFMAIRPDGAASPAFTRAMGDPAWRTLVGRGHQVKDFTVARARELGVLVTVGTELPCVITLRRQADGKHKVARGAVPMPTTSDAIARLAEGVP